MSQSPESGGGESLAVSEALARWENEGGAIPGGRGKQGRIDVARLAQPTIFPEDRGQANQSELRT